MAINNYTEADLQSLQQALASGEFKSKHGDRYVEYRSVKDMEKIEAKMIAALYPAAKRKTTFRLSINQEL